MLSVMERYRYMSFLPYFPINLTQLLTQIITFESQCDIAVRTLGLDCKGEGSVLRSAMKILGLGPIAVTFNHPNKVFSFSL